MSSALAYNEASKRIRQLEKLNATLAAEIDLLRLVVDAVRPWKHTFEIYKLDTIVDALTAYEAAKERE